MTDTLKMAREALADMLEAADSMAGTYCCIQGRHPEEDDTHTHDQWAEDFLQERAAAARAAIAAIDAQQAATVGAQEPDMRHPKIQALIGGKARREIELRLVEQLLDDPDCDLSAMDMEYWNGLHDKLRDALMAHATPPAVQALPPFRVSELLIEAGYSGAAECAHFINGLRHAEAAHGIGAAAQMDAPPAVQAQSEPLTYSSTQATNCAGCGEHKHTPLRIDAMGGYICLTCIDKKLGTVLGEFGYPAPQQPLTDAEFGVAWRHHTGRIMGTDRALLLQAKAATESAHGIGAAAQGGEHHA